MIKMATLLFEEMTPKEADYIFAKYGIQNASSMSFDELKDAWRKLSKRHHPDKGGQDISMRYINAAYDVLSKSVRGNRPLDTIVRAYWNRVRPQHVSGGLYAGAKNWSGGVGTPGHKFDNDNDAAKWMKQGGEVFAPGVSASNYHNFFRRMGFVDVKVIDYTSSAGDWVFGIRNKDLLWYVAFQENAYPKVGFIYSIDFKRWALEFDELLNMMG